MKIRNIKSQTATLLKLIESEMAKTDKQTATMDYIAMMADIELEEDMNESEISQSEELL